MITLSPAGFPSTVAVTNTGLPTGLTTETQTFTYNAQTARLQKVCYDVAQCGSGTSLTGVEYNYDGAGNTISKTTYGAGAGTTYYGFDAANELCWAGATFGDPSSCTLPSGNTAFTYTANGDRLGFGTTALRYDLAHRLTKATIGSTAHTFTYDALGNRSKDTGPTTATTTTYAWDPNGSIPMMASAKLGSTQKDFFYGGGLQAMRQGSTIYYYDKDQTGSVSNILKANGTLEYSYSYQPYGQFRSNNKNDSTATNNFNPMVFDSEYADLGTTGFVDLRAREYDPSTGTFLTSDPIGEYPDYTFAGGNPAIYSDPTGESPLIVLGVALVIGAVLGTAVYGADVAFTDRGWSWGGALDWAVTGAYLGALCVSASISCYGAAAGVVGALGIGAPGAGASSASAVGTSGLSRQLAEEEAASIFTKSGGLQESVIQGSRRIIAGSNLGNPEVVKALTADGSNIADWGKFATQAFQSPSGPFQVHFYYNPMTGVANYNFDFKAVFIR